MTTATSFVLLMAAVGTTVAMAAAARSTWSPCGVSMLSSLTPLAERGRGHRFGTTAGWFVAGAVAGGATLGALAAALAAGVWALGLPPVAAAALVAGAALVAAGSDARVPGLRLPVHHRQVNERWLDGYRPWVYGAGFGWQIGCGLATYIVTAGVYLVVAIGVLSGRPALALALGAGFGLVRGLAVFAGRRATTPEAVRSLHRRLARWAPVSARATVAVLVGAGAVVAAWTVAVAAGGRWAAVWSHPAVVVAAGVGVPAVAGAVAAVASARTPSPVAGAPIGDAGARTPAPT